MMVALQKLFSGPDRTTAAARTGVAVPRGWIILGLALTGWAVVATFGMLAASAISATL